MRNWINLIEKVVERHPRGWDLVINPTRNEYRKLVMASRVGEHKVPLRGLITLDEKRDVYLWDSYQAAHGGIKDRYDLENSMHIFVADDNAVVSVLTLWRYERLGYDRKQIDELVRTNPVLNRIFPQGFQILIED